MDKWDFIYCKYTEEPRYYKVTLKVSCSLCDWDIAYEYMFLMHKVAVKIIPLF